MAASTVSGLFTSFQPGARLVDGGEVQSLANYVVSSRSGIAGSAAPGTLLPAHINEVVSGAAVMLPLALPGNEVIVVTSVASLVVSANTAVNPLTGVTDVVNGAASVTLAATGGGAQYICYAPGKWAQFVPTVPLEPASVVFEEAPAAPGAPAEAVTTPASVGSNPRGGRGGSAHG